MVLNPQRQIDTLEQETKVTQTIDDYNILQSPYTVNVWNYKDPTSNETPTYEYTNWIRNTGLNSITGLHGVETDLIHITFPAIKPLEHKLITRIDIVTDIIVEKDVNVDYDNYPSINNVGIGIKDTYNTIQLSTGKNVGVRVNSNTGELEGIPISNDMEDVIFTNNENNLIWGYNQENLDQLIQSGEFSVEFNINLGNNTHNITLKNTYLKFYFTDYFESESEAVENRLESLGYTLDNASRNYQLYVDDDGDLWQEYYSRDSPIFSIEDGDLYVEGTNLPTYQYDSFGDLYYGQAEDSSIYLTITNQTSINNYHTSDTLLITTALLYGEDQRVPNRNLTLTIYKQDGNTYNIYPLGFDNPYTLQTDTDGYAYQTINLNTKGTYKIEVTNTSDNYYNTSTDNLIITIGD